MIKRFAMATLARSIKIFRTSFFVLIMTACASSPATLPVSGQTSTPLPTETPSKEITLYRGDPQRTGVFDFPAIRHQPNVKWQTKVSSTWLMPPILAGGALYTGSGDGV